LADLIETYTELNSSGIGLLSTLPIFFMGVGALCVKFLRSLFGEERGIGIGLAIIVVSCFGRFWLHTTIGLIVTAIGAGIGIATVQALMPAFIKRHFGGGTGRIIGFYSSAIVG
jgi:CP family cyanate transporter-like MFS transporter